MTPRGFLFPKPDPRAYKLGGRTELKGQVLVTNGQWDSFIPLGENQALATEPEACTSFGTLNCAETLIQQELNESRDYSDRLLAWMSGTTQEGNDPDTVAQTLRKKGDVYEAIWPYTNADNSWATFYEVPPNTIVTDALEFTTEFDFGYQQVPANPQSMMTALQSSPLGAAGFAWATDQNGYYYSPPGTQPCHWFMVYGYVENQYWKVLDSYPPYQKKLRWDYNFAMARGYTLHRQIVSNSWFNVFLRQLRAILGI